MGAEHVIALIASNLMVRNAVMYQTNPETFEYRDPIEEARELINLVVASNEPVPPAPNTKGGPTNG